MERGPRLRAGCGRTLSALPAVIATALATALAASPVHAGLRAGQSGAALVVVDRAWSAGASVVLGLPAAPEGAATERRTLRTADRALLAALREATAGAPARVTLDRDGAGRYFVAATTPDALEEVLRTMRRVAASPLPSRHLADAIDAVARADAFRDGSPKSRFNSAFASFLSSSAAVRNRAAPRIQDSAWVVVGSGLASFPLVAAATASGDDPPAPSGVALVRSPLPPVPGEPLRTELPADVVTTWVGSAYRFSSTTTLLQAHFLRLVLEGWVQSLQEPSLYEFATEIDASGRLLVRMSASREDAGAWEARVDRAVAAIAEGGATEGGSAEPVAEEPDAQRVATLTRRARGVWSRQMADPAACARAVAEALLRGASAEQATAFATTSPIPPSVGSVADAAKGLRLAARVLYGT